MNILVFNCGSSSLTYKIFKAGVSGSTEIVLSGKAHRVGVKGAVSSSIENTYCGATEKTEITIRNHGEAAALALQWIIAHAIPVDLVGHRFVHGGNYFKSSEMLNKETLQKLKLCLPLAPIHNPISLEVIQKTSEFMPSVGQYVTFDSAFHSTIPPRAYTYCLPRKVIEKFGFRKYGFHGLSYSYVTTEAARMLGRPVKGMKIVACHLGTGGSSAVAIGDGKSLDNSMGYSPLTGLVMSTRSGDFDPLLAVYIMYMYGYRSNDLLDLLNKKSGLLGVSGFSSDITDILAKAGGGNAEIQSNLAVNMYVHRLKKYIGSYTAVLGGIDALVFTDDIGARNAQIRQKICNNMQWCGIEIDEKANMKEIEAKQEAVISTINSKVKILVIPTKEELVICLEGMRLTK
jgi:acetate kinase